MSSISFGQKKLSKGNYVLRGKILGQNSGYIYLMGFFSKDGKFQRDSTLIKNGTFSFIGIISQPAEVDLSLTRDGSSDLSGNTTTIFLEPKQMSVTLKKYAFDKAVVTGSKSQKDMDELNKQKEKINKELNPLSKKYNDLNLEYIAAMHRTNDVDSLQYYNDRAVEAKDAMDPYVDEIKKNKYCFCQKTPCVLCLGISASI